MEGAGTRKGKHFSDQPSLVLLSAADRLSTALSIPRLLGIWFGMSSLAPRAWANVLCLTFHVVAASTLVRPRTESEETWPPPGVTVL